jgi:hypothetical protein
MLDLPNNILSFRPEEITCHSGGALGSDTLWELFCELYSIKVMAYSYKTKNHKGPNKIEISDEDYNEGILKIKKANKLLGRKNIDKHMSLLARNWAQVKYSQEIFAIGTILKEGDISKSGYIVTSKSPSVDGGTGYAVQMAILNEKTVYVFDQNVNSWFKWSYIIDRFLKIKGTPKIQCENFAGVGTRDINAAGKKAIEQVFIESFENNEQKIPK